MEHAKIVCGTHALRVRVCEGALERLRGLLGRPEPEPGVAMLIEPCWAVHTVGMRYSIDVVFCDARWRVLRVVTALPPRRFAAARGAVRALELRAHSARPLGLVLGARLEPDTRLRAAELERKPGVAPSSPISAPVRALAGLAALTLVAALLLGGCAGASVTSGAAPSSPLHERSTVAPRAAAAGEREPNGSAHRSASTAELRMQADIDYASRTWPLAEAGYRALLSREPGDPEHWQRLGVIFLQTGRATEAVAALEAATRLREPDARTLQNLAIAHLRAAADALHASAERGASRPDANPETAGASPHHAHAVEALLPPDLRGRMAGRAP